MENEITMALPAGVQEQKEPGRVKLLLENELVEVKLKGKGLRGSWHPGVVVGVKPGKRIVEYDELLTKDSTAKLRETITVSKFCDGEKSTRALSNGTSLKMAAKRGKTFIRPRPPPVLHPSPLSWTEGSWVDCWYQDAWWEGILGEDIANLVCEDVASLTAKSCVTVFYPDEDDTSSTPVKNMRLTQDWDDESGSWELRPPQYSPRSQSRARGGSSPIPTPKMDHKKEDVNESRSANLTSANPDGGRESLPAGKSEEDNAELLNALQADKDNGADSSSVTVLPETNENVLDSKNTRPSMGAADGGSGSVEQDPGEPGAPGLEIATTSDDKAAAEEEELSSADIGGAMKPDDGGGIVDERKARQLLAEVGWKINQCKRKNGKTQWYYKAPKVSSTATPVIFSSLVAAISHQAETEGTDNSDGVMFLTLSAALSYQNGKQVNDNTQQQLSSNAQDGVPVDALALPADESISAHDGREEHVELGVIPAEDGGLAGDGSVEKAGEEAAVNGESKGVLEEAENEEFHGRIRVDPRELADGEGDDLSRKLLGEAGWDLSKVVRKTKRGTKARWYYKSPLSSKTPGTTFTTLRSALKQYQESAAQSSAVEGDQDKLIIINSKFKRRKTLAPMLGKSGAKPAKKPRKSSDEDEEDAEALIPTIARPIANVQSLQFTRKFDLKSDVLKPVLRGHPFDDSGMKVDIVLNRTRKKSGNLSELFDRAGEDSRDGRPYVVRPFGFLDTVLENDEKYIMHVHTLGFSEEDVQVHVKTDALIIQAKYSLEHTRDNFAGRYSGGLSCNFLLPKNAELEQITAELRKGILYLTIPKSNEPMKETIDIRLM